MSLKFHERELRPTFEENRLDSSASENWCYQCSSSSKSLAGIELKLEKIEASENKFANALSDLRDRSNYATNNGRDYPHLAVLIVDD